LLLFFLAVLVWISQAGSGAALLDAAPPLPRYPDNPRISRGRAARIVAVGRPLPHLLEVKGIWIIWAVLAAVTLFFHESRSFKTVTTLESYGITRFVVCVAITIVLLILFDVVQFLQLWDELQGLLRALSRQQFRRSFVPIEDFKWPNLWSFSGISFRDRRALDAALADCVLELSQTHKVPPFQKSALRIDALRTRYNRESMPRLTRQFYIRDRIDFFANVSNACTAAAKLVQSQTFMPVVVGVAPSIQALQRAIGSLVKKEDAFRADREQVAALPGWQQAAERLICLMYIGFIQAVIGRLHTLLVSVASMFSLLVLGIAIYPFVPFSPLLVAGTALLAGIGWAFFKVFSEMDTDPVLARIVNGDDRKLQTNFYFKFAEALALPLLALGSSVLPGGTGRLLELAQTVLNHAQ
jgi:hypothetical protein